MDIKFSVIIPAYNAAEFISGTLDSVRNQEYDNYEVIIVNDGSEDDTEEVILRYKKQYPSMDIHYIWQENGGVSAARYRCGQEAKGDFLAFLDADDIWYKNKLKRVAEEIERTNADVIYHDFVEVSSSGKRRKVHCRTLNMEDPLSDLILNGNALATSGTCSRMSLYREIDPFSDKNSAYEDYECWIRYASSGARFSHIKECLSEYVRNKNSLTLVNDKYVVDSYHNSLTFLKYLDKSKYSTEAINEIKKHLKMECDYNLARSYHKQEKYGNALSIYKELYKSGKRDIKFFGIVALAFLHIKR